MTNLNTKSRILISVILIASMLGVFIYAQGADLTLDAVEGVYNARWLNGTDSAISNIFFVDNLEEYSLASGVTIDGVLIKDADTLATSFTIGANTLTTSEWAFLDGLNQALKTGDISTFAGGTFNGVVNINSILFVSRTGSGGLGISLDSTDTGGNKNSPRFVIKGNFFDGGDHEVECDWQLLAVGDPSLSIRVDDDGATPSIVESLRIHDDKIDMLSHDIKSVKDITPTSNNTGSIGVDTVRFADGYFVTVTAKNTVTGKIIENEIVANPGESFEEGDLVQVLDTSYFTKTTKKLANVIGVVTLNPGNIQIGTETVTSWVDEIQDVTRSVSWLESVTDAYGQVYEVERTGEEPVYEWYLEMIEDTLSDGNTVLYYENRTRIKTETVQVEVTTEIPVMAPKNEPVLCVFGGPTLVKISEPVLKHDVLVASAVDGEARPLRTVLPELVEQFGDMEMNFENVLMAIEKLNYKTLGRVMEDSTGVTCWAMIGY